MVDNAVRTRTQIVKEEQLQLKDRLLQRMRDDRERRQEEEKLRQQQELRTMPGLNNIIYSNQRQQRDDEMQILYPIGLPQMQRTDAQQEELQNRPGVENQQFKEQIREADLRAGLEQLKQKQDKQKHGAELKEEEADNRIHQARHKPGQDLNKDELHEKFKKEEKEFKNKTRDLQKLTKQQMQDIFNKLTGRKPSENHYKLTPKGQQMRKKVLLRQLDQKKRKRVQQIMKQASRSI